MITVLSNVAARQDYGTDDRGGSPHFRDGTLAPCRYTHQDRDKDKEARTGDRLPNDSGRRDVTSQYPCSSTIWQRYQNKHDAPRGKPYEPNSDFNQELDHRCDDSRFTQQERWNGRDQWPAAHGIATTHDDDRASIASRCSGPASNMSLASYPATA